MRVFFSLSAILLLSCFKLTAQYTYFSGNYNPILQILANPAAGIGRKAQIDVTGFGNSLNFSNSFLKVKRSALAYPTLPDSWGNLTPNVDNNIYKNFVPTGKHQPFALQLSQRVLLPSAFYQINHRHAVAIIGSYRQYANLYGVSSQLANLFYNEFDLSVLQNTIYTPSSISATKMSWLEYGLNYAYALLNTPKHRLYSGITLKLNKGLQAGYFKATNTAFLLSTVDNSSYFDSEVSLALSEGGTKAMSLSPNFFPQLKHSSSLQTAADLGISYEYRKATASDSNAAENLYKLKLSAAITDIGNIRFRKQENYYDLSIHVTQADLFRYMQLNSAKQVQDQIKLEYPANTGSPDFRMALPTALNIDADYNYNSRCYLNVSLHAPLVSKTTKLSVYDFTSICLTPRYEKRWYEIAVPFTFNSLYANTGSYILPGLALRGGPVCIGTYDLTALFRKNLAGVNAYLLLKYTIK